MKTITTHPMSREEAQGLLDSIAPTPDDISAAAHEAALDYARGLVIDEVAKSYGKSRQAVSNMVNMKTPWPISAIRSAREAYAENQRRELVDKLTKWSQENPFGTLSEAAALFAVSERDAAAALGDRASRHRTVPPRERLSKFSNADLLDQIKKWHKETGSTKASDYSEWARERGVPGHQIVAKRFQRWSYALQYAGIAVEPPMLHSTKFDYSEEDVWSALYCALEDTGQPTSTAYTQWATQHKGAPTLSTVCVRLGKTWSEIRPLVRAIAQGTSTLDPELVTRVKEPRDWTKPPAPPELDVAAIMESAARDVGANNLTQASYGEWARANQQPRIAVLREQSGMTWPELVASVGGDPSVRPSAFTQEQLVEALVEFNRQYPNGSSADYMKWREKEPSAPALSTYLHRYGSWREAQSVAERVLHSPVGA